MRERLLNHQNESLNHQKKKEKSMCKLTLPDAFVQCGEIVVDLAITNVNQGGLPFAAIIVNQSGQLVGAGVNQVAEHLDCTAHAEIQAIRNACLNQHDVSLRGATLIASGEPCALCYMVTLMAGIQTAIILADRHEAKEYGFDYLWKYEYLNYHLFHEITVTKLNNDRKMLPFELCKLRLGETGLQLR